MLGEKNKRNYLADGFVLQHVYTDLWAMKGIGGSSRHLPKNYTCTIEDLLSLFDPRRVHRNSILKSLFLRENITMNLDTVFSTVMEMLSEFTHRGGFHLGWPRPSAVRNRLELGSLSVPYETIDGSHLMSYLEAQSYEVFFQAALHVEEIQRLCYKAN